MNKEFVSYEIAFELKELGFDEPCFKYWVQTYNDTHTWMDLHNKALNDDDCKAPLYQQAFRWFREKYYRLATIHLDWNGYSISIHSTHLLTKGLICELRGYLTYEEAELACIIKLIDIFKSKKD